MNFPILCIDTATKACSVSLFDREKVWAQRNVIEDGYVHAEQLHVLCDEVLHEAGIEAEDLHAVAVGKGPGSYTGLRIGVSAAKGFAFGVGIPLISLPTLQIMSAAALDCENIEEGILRPLLDARRMEVYSAAYDISLREMKHCQALLLEESPFAQELEKGPVYFFGDGMPKAREDLQAHPHARFIEDIHPNTALVKDLVFKKLEAGDVEDVAYFEPFYLKDFIAKLPKKML
ncbi:MAG: tRNA (adenosine(37)-N6)-threonylcarbamoyltransferase complex dimerization subunit type 1 TsaB [Flavobacteriales bacterium]|nr:tRNA (adenosine(37)-N6)-threonylcarbamoyltransferase complex dimerization subunit type 1 TsaB [Flavobacteriales bacterium]